MSYYTPEEITLSQKLQAEGMPPLLANTLCKEPRAPEYARLSVALSCNGAGIARGERLAQVTYDALATVKRLEIELVEARSKMTTETHPGFLPERGFAGTEVWCLACGTYHQQPNHCPVKQRIDAEREVGSKE